MVSPIFQNLLQMLPSEMFQLKALEQLSIRRNPLVGLFLSGIFIEHEMGKQAFILSR